MFQNLVASEGKQKKKTMSAGALTVSVLLHGLLAAGAVAASVALPEVVKKANEDVTYVDVKEPEPEPPKPEPEPEPPPPEPEAVTPPPVAKGYQELVPPKEPPKEIPKVDPTQVAVDPKDFSGIGEAGGVAKGVEKGVKQNTAQRDAPADQGVYDVSVVEERPKLLNGPEIIRLISRQYPPLLRDANITGTVQLLLVVGEDGRVRKASVASASNDQFGDVAVKISDRMKFRPAKVGGRAVPVSVTFPIQFNLDR